MIFSLLISLTLLRRLGFVKRALDIPASTNQNIASILCSQSPISSEYVYWWLYYRYNEIRARGEGGAQPALNAPRVRLIPIPLAPLGEQKQIASRIEELSALADNIEKEVIFARENIEILEESILSKAFRGQLVSQDLNDELASVLLEEIKAQPLVRKKLRSQKSLQL